MCHGECLYVTCSRVSKVPAHAHGAVSVCARPSSVRVRPSRYFRGRLLRGVLFFSVLSRRSTRFRLSRLTWVCGESCYSETLRESLLRDFRPRWYGMGDCWCYDCAIVFSSLKAPTTMCSMAAPVCPVSSIGWFGPRVQHRGVDDANRLLFSFFIPTSLPKTFRALKILGF